ncbi:DUF3375 domain-containing protein [Micrococcus sp.]|uniref:DUF3375 domain-containing protein n=1 Tax=Micrococcus sp. TaxID=1271 RepID=UPI002A917F71|nr:DUF3375 domain-containing protein [Micrococcus sp.]MDY6054518.1 DUF3375 domain-containing protein [Micrococcus sp.]
MKNQRIEGAYQRARTAFSAPTLRLLHGSQAPFVVAALGVMFTSDRQAVAVADAHVEIQDMLDRLRAEGYDDDRALPAGTGRDVCRRWAQSGWLTTQIEEDVEVYRLSAHAVTALEVAGRTGPGRARVSGSRVRTLLDAVDQLAQDAEPDPAERIAALEAERDALDAQLARLKAGEEEPVSEEELREEAENVLHLTRELPADFARVAESITRIQRQVVTRLRADDSPAGEVLREYLEQADRIMEATPEGRAFAGALRLIGDPEQIDQLTDQLEAVLALPFVRLLSAEQRRELAAVARRIEHGVDQVLTAQRRASHVITAQVRTHDPARDREVDDLLRRVMTGLQAWTEQTRGRAADPVPVLRGLPVAAVGNLRLTVRDPRPPGRPAPLHRDIADPRFPESQAQAWGGPRYRELEEHLAALGADGTQEVDLAAAFEAADDDVRRPADLLGLLELAHRNGMRPGGEVSVVEARRPDGTRRRFAFASLIAKTHKDVTP